MAQAAWKRSGSPIGKKGARKANPKYKRRSGQQWSDKEVKQHRSLAKANTPTGVISLKMERPPASISSKAQREGISLETGQPLALQQAEAFISTRADSAPKIAGTPCSMAPSQPPTSR